MIADYKTFRVRYSTKEKVLSNVDVMHLFSKYLLSIYCVSGTVLRPVNTAVNKMKFSAL